MKAKIREVRIEDRDQIIGLVRKCCFLSNDILDEETEAGIRSHVDEQIRASSARDSQSKMFVGVVDDKPIAFAYVTSDNKRGGYIVDDLYTREAHRGHGIASTLIESCEDFVAECGGKDIHLSVVAENKNLVSWYENRGWLRQCFSYKLGEVDIDPGNTTVRCHLFKKDLQTSTQFPCFS